MAPGPLWFPISGQKFTTGNFGQPPIPVGAPGNRLVANGWLRIVWPYGTPSDPNELNAEAERIEQFVTYEWNRGIPVSTLQIKNPFH